MSTTRTQLAAILAALLIPAASLAQAPQPSAGAGAGAGAGGMTDQLKTKAKDTGKSGVKTGSAKGKKKVQPVVGEEKATAVEAVAKEKGGQGVDAGVDKAAQKLEGAIK